jgi:AcrR family transcriptional regulator
MSPRQPKVLKCHRDQDLRGYLIATAARLIRERDAGRLSVREIARQAQVADGVLYNYFEDKEDLLAHALLAHVNGIMSGAPGAPPAGTGTVTDNLRTLIDNGLKVLTEVAPAFIRLLDQPRVLSRFYRMAGGDQALGTGSGTAGGGHVPWSLAEIARGYLAAEQQLGRVASTADIDAAARLITGAIHGQVLPPLLFNSSTDAIPAGPDLAARLASTMIEGIGSHSRDDEASRHPGLPSPAACRGPVPRSDRG